MKKIISVILISIATLGLMACADTAQNKTTAEKSVVEESNKGTEETNENDRQEDRTSEENTPSEQENITRIIWETGPCCIFLQR